MMFEPTKDTLREQ